MTLRFVFSLVLLALPLVQPAQAQHTPPTSGVHHMYVPFVDASAWPLPDLDALSTTSGANGFVLGFVVNDASGTPCTPKWGGFASYHATQAQAGGGEVHLLGEVQQLRAMGGRAMISFGGAFGTPIAATCTSPEALADAYAAIVDTYGIYDLDFDVEGPWITDTPSRARRVAALVRLQTMRPSVRLWLTLPVLPTGLDAHGVSVLTEAVAGGVDLTGVNVMAMNYGAGTAPDPSQLGAYAIQAMTALHGQIKTAYAGAGRPLSDAAAWSMVGVTPMIGVNDTTTEIFRLNHAAEVVAFAIDRRIGMVSIWSIGRDRPCGGGSGPPPQANCSSIEQSPYAFSEIFSGFEQAMTAAEGGPHGEVSLGAPQPNPAVGTARVAVELSEPASVRLVVFDALGRLVATVAEGAYTAGRHEMAVRTDGLAPGVYVLRLVGAGAARAQRLVVTR